MQRRPPAPLLVLAAIVSVQSGSALARHLFTTLGPAGVTFLRLALAALVLLPLLRPAVRGRSRRELTAVVVFGVVLAGMNLCFYEAISSVPLGVAVTIEFVGPLGVALLGARRAVHLLWVVMAGAGVLLLAHGGSTVQLRGLALAALAGMFWAGYILSGQRLGRLLPGADGLALALPVGALLVAPFGLSSAVRGVHAHPAVLAGALGVAMLSSVVTYSLELTALRRLSASVFGVLMSLEPAAAAIAGLVFLGQGLSARAVAAVVLVSLASAGSTLTHRHPPPVQPLE